MTCGVSEMDKNQTVYIYGLTDPREPNALRYIGKANEPAKRMSEHRTKTNTTHRATWIAKLQKEGVDPTMTLLLKVSDDDWAYWERRLIALFSKKHPLVNHKEGGQGGKHSLETRKKISASLMGHTLSAETRKKISQKKSGVSLSPEHRRNIAKAARVRTPKRVAQLRQLHENQKGVPLTPERRANISRGLLGNTNRRGG